LSSSSTHPQPLATTTTTTTNSAPTAALGLAPHCKDTFFGRCRLRVWRVDSLGRRSASPLVDATSTTAALEVRPWGRAIVMAAAFAEFHPSTPRFLHSLLTPPPQKNQTTTTTQVGGGPWWAPWSAKADMKEPFRSLVRLPIDVGALANAVPPALRPPGL
jgi:tocopherol cyclase